LKETHCPLFKRFARVVAGAAEPERHPHGCITVDQLIGSDALGNDFAGEVGEPN
jgi:hypothetical protein